MQTVFKRLQADGRILRAYLSAVRGFIMTESLFDALQVFLCIALDQPKRNAPLCIALVRRAQEVVITPYFVRPRGLPGLGA